MHRMYLITFLSCFGTSSAVMGQELIYYQNDFEENRILGKALRHTKNKPEIVKHHSLKFSGALKLASSQIMWNRNAEESAIHCVGFDFFAERDTRIIQFMDMPLINRVDIEESGFHRFDIYYEIASQLALPYLDGEPAPELLRIQAPSENPISRSVRISTGGEAYIDNFLWRAAEYLPGDYEPCN